MALVATACAAGARPTTSATTSPAAGPPRPQLAVEVRTESLVDPTRGTGAHSGLPASDTRSLPTKVFAPADGLPGRPYPLIVFAHGSGGLGTGYDVLLRTWAAAGYVVAAPAFPVATENAEPGAWIDDLPNLPADVSFVADQMVKRDAGLVDPGRIGAAGHSMGAMVTLTVAANTCCHDARIKAAVVLAGRETPGSGQYWSHIRTPILFVHGDADDNVPYADGRRAYADAPPPRFLLTVLGGDHGDPYTADASDPRANLVVDATVGFFDHYLKGAPDGLARLEADGAKTDLVKLEQEQ